MDLIELEHILRALCLEVQSDISNQALLLLDKKDYVGLLRLRVAPQDYSNANSYFLDNQIVSLLRKLKVNFKGIDRKRVALDTFYECEKNCKITNDRLAPMVEGIRDNFEYVYDTITYTYVYKVRAYIRSLLRRPPKTLEVSFGKGAVFESVNNNTPYLSNVPGKLSNYYPSATTTDCLYITNNDRHFRGHIHGLTLVRGNRFTTVPKDFEKDRGICVEPSVNVGLQISLGSLMKDRIKAFSGINLRGTPGSNTKEPEGQYLHHKILSSRQHEWSTIDLSNASDTVAYKLVQLLLPEDWFELLSTLRSGYTLVGKHWVKLEKFSSMGNGFTFELETLIFMALLHGIGLQPGTDCFVYGDDIILPRSYFTTFTTVLKFFGFQPNEKKSFRDGRFFESCGEDFFDGVPVRAYYQKELPNEPQRLVSMANGIRRAFTRHGYNHDPCSPHWRMWNRVIRHLPDNIRRCRGPDTLGDQVIHDRRENWDSKRVNDIQYVRGLKTTRPESLDFRRYCPTVQMLSALYGVWDSPHGGLEPFLSARGAPSGYRVAWIETGL